MSRKTAYRATWDPGKPLKLGQVGKLDSFGVFNVYSSLEKEGIPVETEEGSTGELDYTSSDSVTISTKLSGSVPAAGSVLTDADAGFSFDFKSDQSIVFQAGDVKTGHITNLGAIEKQILEKYKAGNWNKDWLIISELITAGSATIIISNSSNVKLELKAKAGVATGSLKLTDSSLGLTVAHEQGSTLKYISQKDLTPLYRLVGIVAPWLSATHIGPRSVVEKGEVIKLSVQPFNEAELSSD
ncbi:hypothetical protein [Pedobacter miscanthi]|uniref:hypothetical protein n=1 Tax=Pedobacter miscanthi TaxID=2259170 RepID=UPI00292E137B|nr:hypothetical protein [Pedobacter miscanthi]